MTDFAFLKFNQVTAFATTKIKDDKWRPTCGFTLRFRLRICPEISDGVTFKIIKK